MTIADYSRDDERLVICLEADCGQVRDIGIPVCRCSSRASWPLARWIAQEQNKPVCGNRR